MKDTPRHSKTSISHIPGQVISILADGIAWRLAVPGCPRLSPLWSKDLQLTFACVMLAATLSAAPGSPLRGQWGRQRDWIDIEPTLSKALGKAKADQGWPRENCCQNLLVVFRCVSLVYSSFLCFLICFFPIGNQWPRRWWVHRRAVGMLIQ